MSHFTAEHCRRITWAIIDDGRSYFDNVKTTLDFSSGASVVFPQSFLVDIIRNVRYGILVKRANFPNEWLSQRKPNPRSRASRVLVYRDRAATWGTAETTGKHNSLRAEALINNTGAGNLEGDSSTADKGIRGQAHKGAGTVEGTIAPTPTTHATLGTLIGPMNATPRSKR
jgi:hypothetical protein